MIGLDTGFFFRVFEGHEEARRIWIDVVEGRELATVCTLSLFELVRSAYRGKVNRERTMLFASKLPDLCREIPVSGLDLAVQAAGISHGAGIPAIDALIVGALTAAGAGKIYTTDADLRKWQGGPEIVLLS